MTHIRTFFEGGDFSDPCVSFEFFPPKTKAGEENLRTTISELAVADPNFVSVTYGAMGSTRDTTKEIVIEICETQPFPAMAHLTCVGHKRESLTQLLDEYAAAGVDNILALSGDPIESSQAHQAEEYKYALQLVELVKSHSHDFSIGVAAHPEIHPRSQDRKTDRKHLAAKLEQADFAITQFFFYPEYYFQLVEELGELGVTKPVIPGVIPVVNTGSILRFSDLNKVNVDGELIQKLDDTPDPQAKLELATQSALQMSQELLAGNAGITAPGIHLYTLNQSPAPLAIAQQLH